MGFVVHIVITAVAVWISTALPGVDLDGDSTLEKILTLLGVALIFGIINVVLKPIAQIISIPLYILTLGLFGLVLNGLLFWFTGWLSDRLGLPFEVDGFWPGFWGAIIVTLVSWALALIFRTRSS